MYTKPVGTICRNHGLNHHFYTDDSQLYRPFKPTDCVTVIDALRRIEGCLNDIMSWMHRNMLKLNADKNNVILFSSKDINKIPSDQSINVGGATILPSNCARNLGAWLDSKMNMKSMLTLSAGPAMRIQIGHIRQYLTIDATKSLVNSLVTSRIDYCNLLLNGIPKTTLNKIQNVQNIAARLITRISHRSHITPVLKDLHWLPIQYRSLFKIFVITYKALQGQSPLYIRNLLQVYKPTRNDHRTMTALVVPKSCIVMFSDRSFSTAAPRLWNTLTEGIRDSGSLAIFNKSLKTHFFIHIYRQ